MKLRPILFAALFFKSILGICQSNEGYWDKERSSIRDIKLCAGCRTWYHIELPIGTTEVAYRITLLEDNQKLVNSFADLLSAIPTASTQTASLGISLLSTISGDDKCKYFIFSDEKGANLYHQKLEYGSACYFNINPINREVNFLNSNCVSSNLSGLYFAFQSTNTFLDERILLEVVPWIDREASRGWTKEIKDSFINNCVLSLTEITQPRQVCQCVLDKFQQKYRVQDFTKYTQTEIEKESLAASKQCLKETGEEANLINQQRIEAVKLYEAGKYGDAISMLLEIINMNEGNIMDYNNIGYFYILTKQYLKAIKFLKQGELLDESELLIKGNLAHAYLLNGDVDIAKAIYIKYKAHNISDDKSWGEMVIDDFNTFKQRGLSSDAFDDILVLLK